jgi:hypothetical protein
VSKSVEELKMELTALESSGPAQITTPEPVPAESNECKTYESFCASCARYGYRKPTFAEYKKLQQIKAALESKPTGTK